MSPDALAGPLAEDCAALRRTLVDSPLPAVWSLDPQEARRLSREACAAVAAAWQPALAALPVRAVDMPADDDHVGLRRYVPTEASRERPVLLWLHGGGWVIGDLDAADATARMACALSGLEVVSVDYRCAPVDRFPAAAEDALAAADWLLSTGRRIVPAGDSAGGGLAAMVAQQRGADPAVVGQVLIYPATDPSLSSASAHQFTEGPFLTRRDMEWFYEQYLGAADDAADPRVDVLGNLAGSPAARVPAVVMTVGHDPLRDEGIDYARRLRDLGCAVTWIHAPELFHGAFTQSGVLSSAARRVGQVWSAVQEKFA